LTPLNTTGCFAAALAKKADMRAHPAFQNLFVSVRREGRNRLFFRRRLRLFG